MNDYTCVTNGICDMCYTYHVPMIDFTDYNPEPSQTMTLCGTCLGKALALLPEGALFMRTEEQHTAELNQLETERTWLRRQIEFLTEERKHLNDTLEQERLKGARLRTEISPWKQEVERLSSEPDYFRERYPAVRDALRSIHQHIERALHRAQEDL